MLMILFRMFFGHFGRCSCGGRRQLLQTACSRFCSFSPLSHNSLQHISSSPTTETTTTTTTATMCQATEATSALRRSMKRPRSAIVSADSILHTSLTGTSAADTSNKRSDSVVKFSEDCAQTIGRSDTTSDDIPIMWYVPDELEVFRKQARDHVLGKHRSETSRGFERFTASRSKQKSMARKVTLMATSQKGLSADDVRLVVTKASQWAVKDAFRTGCNDYCVVYCPEMMQKMQTCNKRSRVERDEQRNVRQRTVC